MRISTNKYYKNLRGFTLVEVILSTALLVVIAGIGLPIFRQQFVRNDLRIAEQVTTRSLYRAQGLAEAGQADQNWGVYIDTGTVTVFGGSEYATRDPELDEVVNMNEEIVFGGDQEIIFLQNTGEVPVTASFNYSLLGTGSVNFFVNEAGTVSIEYVYE